MSVKAETSFQQRLQVLIRRRGGYLPKKNHGNMITVKGLHDLPFTYRGLSLYWEVKAPEDPSKVSVEQGIHCRLAKKSGGITAIIRDIREAIIILNHIDYCVDSEYSIPLILREMEKLYKAKGLDDGTSY